MRKPLAMCAAAGFLGLFVNGAIAFADTSKSVTVGTAYKTTGNLDVYGTNFTVGKDIFVRAFDSQTFAQNQVTVVVDQSLGGKWVQIGRKSIAIHPNYVIELIGPLVLDKPSTYKVIVLDGKQNLGQAIFKVKK